MSVEYERQRDRAHDEIVITITGDETRARDIAEVEKNFSGYIVVRQGSWEGTFSTRAKARLLLLGAAYLPQRVAIPPRGKRQYRLSILKDLVLAHDLRTSLFDCLAADEPFTIIARGWVEGGLTSKPVTIRR